MSARTAAIISLRCHSFKEGPKGPKVAKGRQRFRIGTLQEGVGALPKTDAMLLHAQRQPIVLIETDADGEGEIGADAHRHLSPRGMSWYPGFPLIVGASSTIRGRKS